MNFKLIILLKSVFLNSDFFFSFGKEMLTLLAKKCWLFKMNLSFIIWSKFPPSEWKKWRFSSTGIWSFVDKHRPVPQVFCIFSGLKDSWVQNLLSILYLLNQTFGTLYFRAQVGTTKFPKSEKCQTCRRVGKSIS